MAPSTRRSLLSRQLAVDLTGSDPDMVRPNASSARARQRPVTASPFTSTPAIFDAVVIPTMSAQQGSGPSSVSSRSSIRSSDLAAASTPATSSSATPDPFAKGKSVASRKRSRLSDETHIIPESSNGIDYDQAIAAALQLQEYDDEDEHKYKKRRILYSDAEEIGDSDVLADLLDSSSSAIKPEYDDDSDASEYHNRKLQKARQAKKPAPRAATSTAAKRKASRFARDAIGTALHDADDPDLFAGDDPQGDSGEGSELSFVDSDDSSEAEESDGDDLDAVLRTNLGTLVDAAAKVGLGERYSARKHRKVKRRGQEYLQDFTEEDLLEIQALGTRKERERLKLEKSHPSIKTMWKDLEAVLVIKPVPAAQPQSINRTLKSFQLEGLDWMIKQEKTQYKGGLLGDEMGMGKTIQAVSLIMSDYPAKDPTLVIVPPVALMQWSNEIKEYTDGKLNVLVFHGQNAKTKGMKVKDLKKFDVIMISYNSLESLYRKQVKGWTRGEDIVKEASVIHAIHFHRLILDEAHSIKSRTTGVAKACFALKSTFKWCLSGTPVQNRIGEFFSLLRFLEVRPFADYYCKRCPCAMLHWDVDKNHRCSSCKHSSLEHVSVFNQELLNPLTQSEEASDRSAAMDKLHMITARIMLRRMKSDHVNSMELPPKEVIIHNEFFGDIERDFSNSVMTNTARTFDTYVSRGVMLNNYANIFGLIMQMRQVANHPDLLLKKHAHEGQNVLVCNICDEAAEDAIRSKCKHDFCRTCVKSFVRSAESDAGVLDCPRCHIPLSIDLDQPEIEQDQEAVQKTSIINRIRMENWTSSTKIEMLVYDLWKLRSKKQTLKSIIFSQFTSMLQLVEWRLRRAGFNTVMLDGSMTPIQRQRSIDHFMNTPECEIFLVSLKAGGVALNLTEASRVFIIDPWWNPAAEWQSADRCHRIGQRRPCVITRLCIEDSVESRIVMLQEKKSHMISSTINNDRVAMDKLTPDDLRFLFAQ